MIWHLLTDPLICLNSLNGVSRFVEMALTWTRVVSEAIRKSPHLVECLTQLIIRRAQDQVRPNGKKSALGCHQEDKGDEDPISPNGPTINFLH